MSPDDMNNIHWIYPCVRKKLIWYIVICVSLLCDFRENATVQSGCEYYRFISVSCFKFIILQRMSAISCGIHSQEKKTTDINLHTTNFIQRHLQENAEYDENGSKKTFLVRVFSIINWTLSTFFFGIFFWDKNSYHESSKVSFVSVKSFPMMKNILHEKRKFMEKIPFVSSEFV